MEKLDQVYGYILYQSVLGGKREFEKARLVDCYDMVQVYINEEWIVTQYKESMGENIQLKLEESQGNKVDILFQSGLKHYCLYFEEISKVNFEGDYKENTESFYEYCFFLDELADTFLAMSKFGKRCVFINGKNIGRFWSEYPINTLYILALLLTKGDNTIIIFEAEGIYSNEVTFTDRSIIEEK